MEWSGVEWSGVEWGGVEWSGVQWSRVEQKCSGRESGTAEHWESESGGVIWLELRERGRGARE